MSEQRTGFMCATDFRHELGEASGGNKIYPSVENLREHRPCADRCGIVEVRIELVRSIQIPATPERTP